MINPKKVLGQNFLTDKNKIKEIVDSIPNLENSNVIEVGPGMGSITFPIAEKAKNIKVIEIDKDLIPVLEEKKTSNMEIINNDILKVDWDDVLEDWNEVNFVSNLPYYISTKIMFKVASEPRFKTMSVMLQKELVDRIFANINTRSYGRLTVAINSIYNLKKKINVPAACFNPKPNVESGFIVLERKEIDFELDEYLKFIKAAFANKRKTLINSLKNSNFEKVDQVKSILEEKSIDLNARAESIDVETYIDIWKRI